VGIIKKNESRRSFLVMNFCIIISKSVKTIVVCSACQCNYNFLKINWKLLKLASGSSAIVNVTVTLQSLEHWHQM
jgi:hypothetical protein